MHQIKLRLHWWATIPQREASSFFLFVALTHKSQSFATRMVRVDGADAPTEVTFADKITFEGVAPGFEIEGQVYCYTYVDPHRAEALRRVSTPKKAMERAAKAARHIRSANAKEAQAPQAVCHIQAARTREQARHTGAGMCFWQRRGFKASDTAQQVGFAWQGLCPRGNLCTRAAGAW